MAVLYYETMTALDTQWLQQPIGNFLKPVQSTLRVGWTVGEALGALRRREIDHRVFYMYVTDDQQVLVGVVPVRSMLTASPQTPLRQIMTTAVTTLPADSTLELAMETFALSRLMALPVVDRDGRLMGMVDVQVYADEMYELGETYHVQDLFQVIGLSLQQVRQAGAWRGYRLRMPWLGCNIIGGILCAIVAAFFDDLLVEVAVMAMFIPLVLTVAESVSIQSLTLVLHLLHSQRLQWAAVRARLIGEWRTGLLLALSCGLIIGGASLAWGYGYHPPLSIAVSVLAAMLGAVTIGTLIPITLHALKLDPKVAAGPIVLMCTDVLTLTVYLGLGWVWLM